MTYKVIGWLVMSQKVLVVATQGTVGDWSAYIDAVPGIDHKNEIKEVIERGSKVSPRIAAAMFPDLDIKKYRS